jgi:hypothetical protein
MRKCLVVLVLVLACGKSKSKSGDPTPDDDIKRITNKEILAAPLTQVTSKAAAVTFTIDLPASVLKPAEVKGSYSAWEPKAAWFDTPSFTVVMVDFPMSPDSTGTTIPMAGDDEERAARVIARAEKLPDGGYINLDQRKDQKFYELEVCRPQGGGSLCCHLIQRDDKPIAEFDAMVQLAEKVCRSMKAKS